MFKHDLLPQITLERIDQPSGRVYKTPEGNIYPSVTSILSKIDNLKLQQWRARVGDDVADRVSTQAKLRGSAIHLLCEKYLLNRPDYAKGTMPFNLVQFNSLKPMLDAHVGLIRAIEYQLYCDDLKTAGTADLIADWDQQLSIVDFKTSKTEKPEHYINNYFLQATAYSMMAKSRCNLDISQIVIIIVVDHQHPQVFVKQTKQYRQQVLDLFVNLRQPL